MIPIKFDGFKNEVFIVSLRFDQLGLVALGAPNVDVRGTSKGDNLAQKADCCLGENWWP